MVRTLLAPCSLLLRRSLSDHATQERSRIVDIAAGPGHELIGSHQDQWLSVEIFRRRVWHGDDLQRNMQPFSRIAQTLHASASTVEIDEGEPLAQLLKNITS